MDHEEKKISDGPFNFDRVVVVVWFWKIYPAKILASNKTWPLLTGKFTPIQCAGKNRYTDKKKGTYISWEKISLCMKGINKVVSVSDHPHTTKKSNCPTSNQIVPFLACINRMQNANNTGLFEAFFFCTDLAYSISKHYLRNVRV